jgi:hypothetical protein
MGILLNTFVLPPTIYSHINIKEKFILKNTAPNYCQFVLKECSAEPQ